jgi:hypothetical protein
MRFSPCMPADYQMHSLSKHVKSFPKGDIDWTASANPITRSQTFSSMMHAFPLHWFSTVSPKSHKTTPNPHKGAHITVLQECPPKTVALFPNNARIVLRDRESANDRISNIICLLSVIGARCQNSAHIQCGILIRSALCTR